MANLRVWFHEIPVGSLSMNEDGRWSFQYEQKWIAERRFAISPHLPLMKTLPDDLAHHKTVEWFFDNLLPEGILREKLASQARIEKEDTWGFLSNYGREGPGALSILPISLKPESKEILIPLGIDELQKMIEKSKKGIPMMTANGGPGMSLPGTQEKLTLRIEEGSFFLPQGAAASTHILKPENVLYPFCPANEWFAMNLAREVGLPTAKASLLTLPNNERAYYVDRYDRQKISNNFIERIHQVDLCQACNVSPKRKYESHGGLDTTDLFSAANLCMVAAQGNKTSMQWLVFNYLIGNNDAHAKNMSYFMRTEKLNVTPFYDILCVETYLPGNNLAMSIGGEIQAGHVNGCHWDAMALESGNDPRALRFIMKDLSSKVEKNITALCDSPVLTKNEKDFVNANIIPVIQLRLEFIQESMEEPTVDIDSLAKLINPHVMDRIVLQIKARETKTRGR